MQREKNYWAGHPRAQAATDAILGGIVGTIAGFVVSTAIVGVAAATSEPGKSPGTGTLLLPLVLPLAGTITGAALAAGRRRKGFTETQRKKARRGAAFGSVIPFVGSGAGTFFWTAKR